MVKKLDLLESDHGCGPNGLSWKAFQNGSNTTLHGLQLTSNVFHGAVRRVGTSPMDSARSSIFILRAAKHAHKNRSEAVSFGRFTDRSRTWSWWRRADLNLKGGTAAKAIPRR